MNFLSVLLFFIYIKINNADKGVPLLGAGGMSLPSLWVVFHSTCLGSTWLASACTGLPRAKRHFHCSGAKRFSASPKNKSQICLVALPPKFEKPLTIVTSQRWQRPSPLSHHQRLSSGQEPGARHVALESWSAMRCASRTHLLSVVN